jgi:terminase small subunit-like protein
MFAKAATTDAETLPAVRSSDGEGRRLTEAQQRFVVAYTTGEGAIGNASEAARRAGYSVHTAGEIGGQLLRKQHVIDAIREANKEQISGKMATKAIALLGRVIDDESVPMKTRVDAARTILDRAGFCALQAPPKKLHDKSMAEMTADELRETMRLARAEMDRATQSAKVINQAPSVADVAPPRGADCTGVS